MSKEELGRLRATLNTIDAELVSSLAKRQRVVENIGQLKTEGSALLRDLAREEQLLTRLVDLAREEGLDRSYVTRIFQEVLEQSVRRQQEQLLGRDNPERAVGRPLIAGYLGAVGSYSHQAAARHFGGRDREVVLRNERTFASLVELVVRHDADYAVLPIENTTAGSINEVYDLLASEPVFIVGEEVQRVDHSLIGRQGLDFTDVGRILGHPQALAQCSKFLRRMGHCVVEAVADTATAAQRVAESDDRSLTAVGNVVTARQYELSVVWPDIANQKENLTRFVVLASQPLSCDPRIHAKTSLLFSTPHQRGSLLKALNVFHGHELNLTKLESRPKLGEAWNYRFYVDFLGQVSEATRAQLVCALEPFTTDLKVLGTYPAKTDHEPSRPRSPSRAESGGGVPPGTSPPGPLTDA